MTSRCGSCRKASCGTNERLLPHSGPEDEEDLALIEARDILFARLLQYRAFKDIAHTFAERMATAGRRHPRAVGLEPHLAALLPELVMTVTPEQLAMVAARALSFTSLPQGEGTVAQAIREAVELSRTFAGFVWLNAFSQNFSQLGALFAILLGSGGLRRKLGESNSSSKA